MGLQEHRTGAPQRVRCAVITVSDTRRGAEDTGGAYLVGALETAGHAVVERAWVPDEPKEILAALDKALVAPGPVQVILFTGGTGIAPRDRTVETLEPRFAPPIPGFGELFRALSFAEIGAASMLSRACAGAVHGRLVCALPGSRNALRLAMERLILPEIGHLVAQLAGPDANREGA